MVTTSRRSQRRGGLAIAAFLLAGYTSTPAEAQGPDVGAKPEDATALAKATQNPIADLISIPLQFNFNNGGGAEDRTSFNLNVQPVVPISVTSGWNVIARAIIPFLSLPAGPGARADGLGDIQAQLFVTPNRSSDLVWGIGPIFSLPTATLDASTTGSWGVGPAAVVVYTTGSWVLGGLATQTWTFADYGDDTEIDQLVVQPFVNYNLGKGWAVSTAPLITASWDAPSGETWTVPLGGGLTWTTTIGGQALNLGAQYFRNLERPDGSTDNQLRFVVAFLFPKKPPPAAPTSVPKATQGTP
jgi:hypothetical protein